MSEDATVGVRLKQIADASIHSTYSTALGRDLHLVKSYAKRLLNLKLENVLSSSGNTTRFLAQYHQNQRQDLSSLRDKEFLALQANEQLLSNMAQLANEPSDGNQRNAFQTNFLTTAGEFIERWSELHPALESTSSTSAHDQLASMIGDAEESLKQMKAMVEAAESASQKLGAEKHSQAFFELWKRYNSRSIVAFGFTVLILFVFLAAVAGTWYYTHIHPIAKDDYAAIVQTVVAKIIGLGAIYYLLVFTARIYRANAHLAAVNLHRATALQIFATFAESTNDEATKNAILLETTRSIYSHTSTGFLAGEDPSSPVQVVEILKALGPNRPGPA
jgi:hypothetical protein